MIDTDKYEGHTEGPWKVKTNREWEIEIPLVLISSDSEEEELERLANARLMADAPDLLAEVKRLRGLIEQVANSEIIHPHPLVLPSGMYGLSVVETEHWDELLIAVGLLEREGE